MKLYSIVPIDKFPYLIWKERNKNNWNWKSLQNWIETDKKYLTEFQLVNFIGLFFFFVDCPIPCAGVYTDSGGEDVWGVHQDATVVWRPQHWICREVCQWLLTVFELLAHIHYYPEYVERFVYNCEQFLSC